MAVCRPVDQLEEVVLAGCRLLTSSPAVRSIKVATDVRPEYPELMHFNDLAREQGLYFIVLGSGGFELFSSSPSKAEFWYEGPGEEF